jgi:maltose O-acetyltransferase
MKNIFSSIIRKIKYYNLRYIFLKLLLSILPIYSANRVRPALLRKIGFSIGEGTKLCDIPLILSGNPGIYDRLIIGNNCLIGPSCYFDMAGKIIIEDKVSIGPQTMFLSGTHECGPSNNRLGPLVVKDVTIGAGTWIGARCTILPGVTIGKGVILAAGAVVAKDIPANTMAGGVPAKVIRELPE